jgi:flagellar hook protein FlgE
MDVIGNNISNVNTVGYKGSSVTFSDILYQTTKSASGPNVQTGTAGTNAMQIGLGANLASITANITKTGGSQRTDNPFDLMIEGDGFFVVNNGNGNYFTKAGSFNVDSAGTLCTPTGATVMGWEVSKDDPTKCVSDTVKPLKIMSPENLYSQPAATKDVYLHGNIDSMDTALTTTKGKVVVVSFFDNLGNSFNAEMKIQSNQEAENNGSYLVSLTNVYDSKGNSIFVEKKENDDGTIEYTGTSIEQVKFGLDDAQFDATFNEEDGVVSMEGDPVEMKFDPATGKFVGIGDENDTSFTLGVISDGGPFQDIKMDFSSITMFNNSGTTTVESTKGTKETGAGAGKAAGNMSGVSIDQQGKIYGVYDNGDNRLLGQVVVASFANSAGLEAIGNNMFAATPNSGEFNGIGEDITSAGGKFVTGVLEMSNVDLSAQFTEMITTQRGFQANSRIITTSDTLLEELINLKR